MVAFMFSLKKTFRLNNFSGLLNAFLWRFSLNWVSLYKMGAFSPEMLLLCFTLHCQFIYSLTKEMLIYTYLLPNLYLTYNFPFTDTFLPALWWMSLFKKVFTLRHVDWICLRKKICKSPINTQNCVRFVVWCKVATVVLYFLSLTPRPKLTLWVTSGSIAIIFYMGQADNYWALCCPSTISSLMAFKVTFIIKTRYWNPVLGEVSHISGVICHFLHQMRLKWWRSLCVAWVTE